MSIAQHAGRLQVYCDSCPASYPNTYARADFAVMVADAKAAGWQVRKIPADLAEDRDTASSSAASRASQAAGSASPTPTPARPVRPAAAAACFDPPSRPA